jgi:FG-GAP repeat protein
MKHTFIRRSGFVGLLSLTLSLAAPTPEALAGKGPICNLEGSVAGSVTGNSVAKAGDVNGDGRLDALVGAPLADTGGKLDSGSVYVVFGEVSGMLTLAGIGTPGDTRGFRIDGAAAGDHAGWSVASAGDVNGDARPDILLGAPGADPGGQVNAGSAYVIFGKTDTTTVDLANIGAPGNSQGYRIDSPSAGDKAGCSVARAGDITGDGIPEVLIGAPDADNNSRISSGSVHVVFGKASSSTVGLTKSGGVAAKGSSRIDGAAGGDHVGWSVAGPGDVTSDGRADVLIGAPNADTNGRTNSGSAYIVFGTTATTIDLAGSRTLATKIGYRIDGAAAGDKAGASVAGAGDVNFDGRLDFLVGAPDADSMGRTDSGSAYVVFGSASTSPIDLLPFGTAAALGKGSRIHGAAVGDHAGWSVAGAGDVNGDARPDFLVGAPEASHNGRVGSGATYIAFGYSDSIAIDLSFPDQPGPVAGYPIDGAATADHVGWSVAGAGDMNSDGRADTLVGGASAYLVHGKSGGEGVDLLSVS